MVGRKETATSLQIVQFIFRLKNTQLNTDKMKQFNEELLTSDWRKNRPEKYGLTMTDKKTIDKHERLLPPELIEGKSILDIGSYISQTGDWCLNNGAAKYTGVEVIKDFADKGLELMEKYHAGENWNVINTSIEDYFANHNEKYDIIFCWGVLFSQMDHAWFIKNLTDRADRITINGRHPKVMWNDNQHEISDTLWRKFEYDIPYQEWQVNEMTQTAEKNASVRVTSAHTSMKAVQLLMESNGFVSSTESYDYFKKVMPEDIGMFRERDKVGFFVLECTRDSSAKKPNLFNEMVNEPEVWNEKRIDWS